jgi:hypothetical protein
MFSNIKNFYFLFTTGRTGTGLLSQCFGLQMWEKLNLRENGACVVAHEPWVDIPVEKAKRVDIYSEDMYDFSNLYFKQKLQEISFKFKKANSIFITDHKIGRFFGPFLSKSDFNFKVIYVKRDEREVVESFNKKRLIKEKSLTKDRYDRYISRLWSANRYHPSDFSSTSRPEDAWNNLSFDEKNYWYVKETELQWKKFKEGLSSEDYLEIYLDPKYSEIEMDSISSFLNLKYDKSLLKIKAN